MILNIRIYPHIYANARRCAMRMAIPNRNRPHLFIFWRYAIVNSDLIKSANTLSNLKASFKIDYAEIEQWTFLLIIDSGLFMYYMVSKSLREQEEGMSSAKDSSEMSGRSWSTQQPRLNNSLTSHGHIWENANTLISSEYKIYKKNRCPVIVQIQIAAPF